MARRRQRDESPAEINKSGAHRPASERAAHLGLTAREGQLMACLARGLLYKEIADRLHVSCGAVHKLQHKVFVKLHVTNRTEAVLTWYSLSRQ